MFFELLFFFAHGLGQHHLLVFMAPHYGPLLDLFRSWNDLPISVSHLYLLSVERKGRESERVK